MYSAKKLQCMRNKLHNADVELRTPDGRVVRLCRRCYGKAVMMSDKKWRDAHPRSRPFTLPKYA